MGNRPSSTNGALVFLIYAMFAFFSLLLVVIGAQVYKNVYDVSGENERTRIVFSYISNKIRMNGGNTYLDERDGIPVLVLEESNGLDGYATLIYSDEGEIKEYLSDANQPFSPKLGESIISADGFNMSLEENGLLKISLAESGFPERSMHINLN